jgi:hypothetical protein
MQANNANRAAGKFSILFAIGVDVLWRTESANQYPPGARAQPFKLSRLSRDKLRVRRFPVAWNQGAQWQAVHTTCGEGACSRWVAKRPQKQSPWCIRYTAFTGFTTASQPSGSKLPRHNKDPPQAPSPQGIGLSQCPPTTIWLNGATYACNVTSPPTRIASTMEWKNT